MISSYQFIKNIAHYMQVCFWTLLFSCNFSSRQIETENSNWGIKKIGMDTIFYNNGRTTKTNIYDLKYIGTLKTKRRSPYIVLSGKSCDDCDENISIFLFSSDNRVLNNTLYRKYSYPGKEYDYLEKNLLYESRVFFGNCQFDSIQSIIWYQKQYTNSGIDSSIFIVQVIDDTLKSEKIAYNKMKKKSFNLNKNCKEIHGVDVSSEP